MAEDLLERTRRLAVDAIKLGDQFPRSIAGDVVFRQLLRSATSVGANYRAARKARSRAEFAAKLQIALEEADETVYWLEISAAGALLTSPSVIGLRREASELTAVLVASLKKVRGIQS